MPRPVTAWLVLLCLTAGPLAAQRAPGPTGTWLDVGLGGGNIGLNALLGITRRSGIHSLSVRGMVASKFQIVIFKKTTTRTLGDLGLLYGVNGGLPSGLYYARAGIGAVWYREQRTDTGADNGVSAEFGVPWEAGMTKLFGSNFGLGLRLAGNLNAFRNNVAALLVLHLGGAW